MLNASVKIGGICYNLNSSTKEATVTSGGNYTGDIVIPSSITSGGVTYSVTAIGSSAFYKCTGLTSLTIPNSVTTIGSDAFYACSDLTSFTIPNSVTTIGSKAFYACSKITSLTIGNNVISIGSQAFRSCKGLTSVTIPNSVTTIGSSAFAYCRGLISVSISKSVTSIGKDVFYNCNHLNYISVESGNTVFDSRDNCNAIIQTSTNTLISGCKNTTIPNNVISIGEGAFRGCTGMATITIPNSVSVIGSWAFSGSGLTSVTIGNSVKDIGRCAFRKCSNLTSVTIPNSVTSIDKGAFTDCSSLTSIHISDIAAWCNVSFGSFGYEYIYSDESSHPDYYYLFDDSDEDYYCHEVSYVSNPLYYAHHLYINGTEIKNLIIPNSVTNIGDYAFYNCSGLTSVTIPNSITFLGERAFDGCSSLTSVIIGNSVTSIGDYAFHDCSGLTSVNIPNSVTSIGESAFRNCSGLISVTIPNSVTSLGGWAFSGCSSLTSVNIGNGLTSLDQYTFYGCSGLIFVAINSNAIVSAPRTTNNSFERIFGSQVQECVIGDDVTSIGESAFASISDLNKLTIGSSVSTIGKKAFSDCSRLSIVTCKAQSVPNTDADAFLSTDINNVTLYVPASLIGRYEILYPWCYFGTICAIEGGDTVSPDNPEPSTGSIVFKDSHVKDLCLVVWDDNQDGQLSYEEAAAVTDLGTIFEDNTDITSFEELKFFTGLTIIAENAFFGCSNLTSITLPTSIQTIGAYAFNGCQKLTTLTIPQGVSDIGSYAFRGCSGLTDVYCKPIDVPITPTNAFYNSKIGNATLHVVETSYNAYKDVEPWKNFKNMKGDLPEPCKKPTIMFVNGKLVFSCETEGVEFTSNILCDDSGVLKGSERDLTATYLVSVYATKEGFEQSVAATAALCWVNTEPMEGVATGLVEIPTTPILIKSHGGIITVEGLADGSQVTVYTVDGSQVATSMSSNRLATIQTTLIPGTVVILKMGNKSVKYIVK